jgi:Domain of unknown function DUF1828
MTGVGLDQAKALLKCVSLFRDLDMLPSGYLRVETAFTYPDGTSVEVFIPPATLLPNVRLTDLGQTTTWLLDLHLKPWLSAKRRGFVEDALRTYGVQQHGGELFVDVTPESLASGVIRLSQACIRMADLMFTRRSSLQSTFVEEVEDFFNDAELQYETGVELLGKFNKPVNVDFSVQGASTTSLVQALSSQNPSAAHTASVEIFRRWHDLAIPERTEQRVTLLDDRSSAYKDEDLKRLGELSNVIAFSDRTSVRELLAA